MISRRAVLQMAGALPVWVAVSSPARASSPEVFNTDGLAIHGYDPVAYFTQNKPVEGVADYALRWMGVTWLFASRDNMTAFEANPKAFAPQYGGYCAYALSKGAIATTVPEAWTIHEDKLYLNFSTGVREIWRLDVAGYVASANGYWPEILTA